MFLDTNRLQMGERFDREFSRALIHSEVVVPIFSHEALQRMKAHDPNVVDNALLEWVLAVELEELHADRSPSREVAKQASRVKKVLPVFVGQVITNEQGKSEIQDMFRHFDFNTISDVIPTATLELALELLRDNGIEPSDNLSRRKMTVRSFITSRMKCMNGIRSWIVPSVAKLASVVADKELRPILVKLATEQPDKRASTESLPAIGAGATTAPSPSTNTSTSLPPIGAAKASRNIKGMYMFLRDQLELSADLNVHDAVYEAAKQLNVVTEGRKLADIASGCCDELGGLE